MTNPIPAQTPGQKKNQAFPRVGETQEQFLARTGQSNASKWKGVPFVAPEVDLSEWGVNGAQQQPSGFFGHVVDFATSALGPGVKRAVPKIIEGISGAEGFGAILGAPLAPPWKIMPDITGKAPGTKITMPLGASWFTGVIPGVQFGKDIERTDISAKTLHEVEMLHRELRAGNISHIEWAQRLVDIQRERPIIEQLQSEAVFAVLPYEKIVSIFNKGTKGVPQLAKIGEDMIQFKLAAQDAAPPPRLLTPEEIVSSGQPLHGTGKTGTATMTARGVEGAGQTLPSGQVIGGGRFHPEETTLSAQDFIFQFRERVIAPVEPVLSWLDDFMVAPIKKSLNKFMYEVVDENWGLKQLEDATGVPVHRLAQVVPGSAGKAQWIIEQDFAPILARLGDDARDIYHLEEYMISLRMTELKRINPDVILPGNLGIGDPLKYREALELKLIQRYGGDQIAETLGRQRFAEIDRAARDLFALAHRNLKAYLDEGIISPEDHHEILVNNRNYIPFLRDGFDDRDLNVARGFTEKAWASLSSTGLKKLSEAGSARKVQSPLQNLIQSNYAVQRSIATNRAARALVEALEVAGLKDSNLAKRSEFTSEGQKLVYGSGDIARMKPIYYFEDGVRQTVYVPPELAALAKGIDDVDTGRMFGNILRALTNPVRYGAVNYNPGYPLIAISRDLFQGMFREKVIRPQDWWKAMTEVWTHGDMYGDTAKIGGFMSGIIEDTKWALTPPRTSAGGINAVDPQEASSILVKILTAAMKSPPMQALKKTAEAVERGNVFVERVSRVATNIKLIRDQVPELERAVRVRDVTVDFSKGGRTIKLLNVVAPFTKAATTGAANMVRTGWNNPRWTSMFAASASFATTLTRAHNASNFPETHEMIPDYLYEKSWVVQYAEQIHVDGSKSPLYFQLPKGEIMGILSMPAEIGFHVARESDDRTYLAALLGQGIPSLATLTSPVEAGFSQFVTPVLGTLMQAEGNRDLFTGRDIVPDWEADLPETWQFDEDTKEISIRVGQATGIPPYKVDYLLNTTFGGLGRDTNWLASMIVGAIFGHAPAIGEELIPLEDRKTKIEKIMELPLVRRIMGAKDSGVDGRYFEDVMEMSKQTTTVYMSYPLIRAIALKPQHVGRNITLYPGEPSVELTSLERKIYQQEVSRVLEEKLVALMSKKKYKKYNDDVEEHKILLPKLGSIQEDIERRYTEPVIGWRAEANAAAAKEIRNSRKKAKRDLQSRTGG